MKRKVVIFIFIVFAVLGGIVFAQDGNSVIYYPTSVNYPEGNVINEDLHLINYYMSGLYGTGIFDMAESDDGVATGDAIINEETNPIGVYDKIFGEDSGEIPGDGYVRSYSKIKFINAVPDVDKIAILLDGYILSENLYYSKATKALELQPGRVPFAVFLKNELLDHPPVTDENPLIDRGGGDEEKEDDEEMTKEEREQHKQQFLKEVSMMVNGDINLKVGKENLVFITGISDITFNDVNELADGNYGVSAIAVNEEPLKDPTKAGISFFNASPTPDMGPVDMRFGSTKEELKPMFVGVTFRSFINSTVIEPGNYYVDIVKSGTEDQITNTIYIHLNPGKKYYVIAFVPKGYGSQNTDKGDDATMSSTKPRFFIYSEE